MVALPKRIIKVLFPYYLTYPPLTTSQETERLMAEPVTGITASPHEDNLRYFDVTISGPDQSPFQGPPLPLPFHPIPTPFHNTNTKRGNRRNIQIGTLSPRRVPNGTPKSPVPDKDIPSEY